MLQVAERAGEEVAHVFVVQAVEDVPSLAAGANEPSVAQEPQLVGDRRLAHPDPGGEVVDAALPLQEIQEQAKAGRIGKRLEDPGQFADLCI
jgi:hypothetical protein